MSSTDNLETSSDKSPAEPQPNLGTEAYRYLLHRLRNGSIRPGERLVEADIASHLGVSRVPVRQALMRLVVEGYPQPVQLLAILAEREFPIDELAAVASSRSQGDEIEIDLPARRLALCVDDAELARRRVPLTVCPLSNLKLCVVDDLRQHPMKRLLDAGLCATVNSDDPAYFGGYMNANFVQTVEALDLSRDDVITLARNSFEASFVSDERRAELMALLDDAIA